MTSEEIRAEAVELPNGRLADCGRERGMSVRHRGKSLGLRIGFNR
jgi:hypothetical protein